MKTKAYFTDNGTDPNWITEGTYSIPAVPWYPHSSTSCPNCGYCPHCGRSNEKSKDQFKPSIPYIGDIPYGTLITS